MTSYCTATEAAKMVEEYYDGLKQRTNEAFPHIMELINSQIRALAVKGIGCASIHVDEIAKRYDRISSQLLKERLEAELAINLGYRVASSDDVLSIYWASERK